MTQTRADSVMEALVNIVIGLAITQAANLVIIPLVMHVAISAGQDLALGLLFTVVSLARQYTLRRMFNGRSAWASIKERFA